MIRQCLCAKYIIFIYVCQYNIIIVINYQLFEIPLRLNIVFFLCLIHVLFAVGCTAMTCYFS